jgi:hypothetical protein
MSVDPRTLATVASHLPAIVGWSSLAYGCFKVTAFFVRVGRTAESISTRVVKAEETVHLIANNHLSHLQDSMEQSVMKQDETNRLLTLVLEALHHRHAK